MNAIQKLTEKLQITWNKYEVSGAHLEMLSIAQTAWDKSDKPLRVMDLMRRCEFASPAKQHAVLQELIKAKLLLTTVSKGDARERIVQRGTHYDKLVKLFAEDK